MDKGLNQYSKIWTVKVRGEPITTIVESESEKLVRLQGMTSPRLKLERGSFDSFRREYLEEATALNILQAQTPATRLLTSMTEEYINAELSSIRLISSLPSEEDAEEVTFNREEVAFNRDFTHCPSKLALCPAETINQKVLNTKGSAVRLGGGVDKGNPYIGPTSQVSILQKTTMLDGPNSDKVVRPYVLSVAPPALDDSSIVPGYRKASTGLKSIKRPEMETYIDTSSKPATLKEENFITAFQNLGSHVQIGASHPGIERVVLSAFGMSAFIDALVQISPECEELGQDIAAESFASMITKLRAAGKEVVFSDANDTDGSFRSSTFWAKVNGNLTQTSQFTLSPVNGNNSALGKGWVKDTDMIVNAWDPDSLTGNGLIQDGTFDGYLGRLSTIHAVHAAACREYNNR